MKITKITTHAINMPLKLGGDVPHASVTKVGRISEMRKVFDLASTWGVRVVPHSAYFGPGLLASIHVCAARPKEGWVERFYCDFDTTPLGEAISPKNGRIAVPQARASASTPMRTF